MKKYLFIVSIIGFVVLVFYSAYLYDMKRYEERMDNNIIGRNCSSQELANSIDNEYKCPYSDRRVLAMIQLYKDGIDAPINKNIYYALIQRDLSKTFPLVINELRGNDYEASFFDKEWLVSRLLNVLTRTCAIDQKKGVRFWEKYYNNNSKYYVPVNKEGKVEYTPGLIRSWKIHAPSKFLGISYKEYLNLDKDKRENMLRSKINSGGTYWPFIGKPIPSYLEEYVTRQLIAEIKSLYTEVGLDENQFLLKEKDMDTVVCPPLDEE